MSRVTLASPLCTCHDPLEVMISKEGMRMVDGVVNFMNDRTKYLSLPTGQPGNGEVHFSVTYVRAAVSFIGA